VLDIDRDRCESPRLRKREKKVDKRYQVFLSSTFTDLKDERRLIAQSLADMSCIPAGMEQFPASDEAQFVHIKRVLADCDYYVLIIGARYGQPTETGVSFTEREYDYAVERGLNVLAFIHQAPDELPMKKSEGDPLIRERLNKFRERVKQGRLVNFWSTPADLQSKVIISLMAAIAQFPAVGWIRANKVASEDLLQEINELRKEREQLLNTVEELRPAPPAPIADIAGMEETFEISGSYKKVGNVNPIDTKRRVSWAEIYSTIAPYLQDTSANSSKVKGVIAEWLFSGRGHSPSIEDQDFQTIGMQFKALGLISITYAATANGSRALFWRATPAGVRKGLEMRLIRTAQKDKQT